LVDYRAQRGVFAVCAKSSRPTVDSTCLAERWPGRVDRWSTIARSAGFWRSTRRVVDQRSTLPVWRNGEPVESTAGRPSRAARGFGGLREGQSTNGRLYLSGATV